MHPKVLDLFCGCGGMSWGLHKMGFDIVAGIDYDNVALKTYERNHPNTATYSTDLTILDAETWLSNTNIDPNSIDCIIGGPPCQGFSKNVPRNQRIIDDPRNLLVKRYLEFVRIIRPKIVIMENVAEMVNAFDGAFTVEILSLLREWGYSADVKVMDAADFGAPQRRRRAFFFGSLCGTVTFPEQTHWSAKEILPLFDQRQRHITVWDAIGDLPSLEHGEGASPTHYIKAPFSKYQSMMRGDSSLLYNHVARPLRSKQYERLASLAPGQGANDLPKHLKPKSHYSGAYGRLSEEMICRTLTRWLFHPGSGRYGHPVDIRTITIREAARLQSFSDDFVFEGSFTQASSQIGNSVPPLMMQAFAPIIQQHLQSRA